MHGAALALGITAFATRQFGHDAVRVHTTSQHMAMIAVGRDALVAFFGGSLKADNDRFLADIKMAEPANQTHSIKLARFFLKAPDQQHIFVIRLQLIG